MSDKELDTDQTESETLLEFPCEFPVKAFGKKDSGFDGHVVEIVRRHCSDISEGGVTSHDSKKGNFIAVTVNITATSKKQIDAIYLDLTASEKVIMAL